LKSVWNEEVITMKNKKIEIVCWAALIFAMGLFFSGMAGGQTRAPAKPPAKASEISKIDLNKATAEKLGKCPGLTSALAKAIVEYREKSGYFKTPEDLLKVKGMTKEILNKLNPKMDKDILYITPAAPSSDEDDEEPNLKPSKC
jgi:competence protein ComEA